MLAHPAKMRLINTDLDAAHGYGYWTKMSPRNQSVPVAESQDHVIDPTDLCRALDDGVEHRLHIRGRAADDAEHFGCRSLMLQGLAQFCVAFLNLLEQTHVFNRDHGLIRESCDQLNLTHRKRHHVLAPNRDCPNGIPFSKHGHSEKRTRAEPRKPKRGI